MNLRDQILSAKDLKKEAIEIPEWGVTVYASELCAGNYDAVMKAHGKDDTNLSVATAIVLGIEDENGNAVFSLDDIEVLMTKSMRVLERLYKSVMRLCGIDLDDTEITQVEKTLPAPQDSGTTTE